MGTYDYGGIPLEFFLSRDDLFKNFNLEKPTSFSLKEVMAKAIGVEPEKIEYSFYYMDILVKVTYYFKNTLSLKTLIILTPTRRENLLHSLSLPSDMRVLSLPIISSRGFLEKNKICDFLQQFENAFIYISNPNDVTGYNLKLEKCIGKKLSNNSLLVIDSTLDYTFNSWNLRLSNNVVFVLDFSLMLKNSTWPLVSVISNRRDFIEWLESLKEDKIEPNIVDNYYSYFFQLNQTLKEKTEKWATATAKLIKQIQEKFGEGNIVWDASTSFFLLKKEFAEKLSAVVESSKKAILDNGRLSTKIVGDLKFLNKDYVIVDIEFNKEKGE